MHDQQNIKKLGWTYFPLSVTSNSTSSCPYAELSVLSASKYTLALPKI